MIHITQAAVDLLEAAVNECDRMMVNEEHRNDFERSESHSARANSTRLILYRQRYDAIRHHRDKLVALYVQIAGRNPWANIPY